MKPLRLEELSDGIFAIVMTILVFELKIPQSIIIFNNSELWVAIKNLAPSIISYVLSFTLLFTYWRAHHFFISVYAKNIDIKLTNLNALFFLLIGLVPFSASVLGRFHQTGLAIIIFGTHIALIGLCLYWMRNYVFFSDQIKNPEIPKREIHGSTVRTLVPVVFALIAIILSFYNRNLSLALFSLAVIFNILPSSTKIFNKILKFFNVHSPEL
ncbi:DUF1211 domain-containing protein [Patescibacteria group bacterium]|nr:DUF1211 domain-containing protein [Patescibacteria group bacterium]MBU1727900.1 DUF1211 domain-containing protein [Patescibacteria group bacterium]